MTVSPLALLIFACTPAGPSGLDEAGETTSEAGDAESGESDGSGESGESGATGDTSDTKLDIPFEPQPCNSFDQDCPEGQKCVPFAPDGGGWQGTYCVPVVGEGEIGDACVYTGAAADYDDCGLDSHCWNAQEVDGESVGTCTPFCMGTPSEPTCSDGYFCQVSSSLSICVLACDPLAQDCGPDEGCFWGSTDFFCVPTSEDIPTGEACGFINDCAPGNICISAGSLSACEAASCCANFCAVDGGDGPCQAIDPDYSCVSFWEPGEAPEGYENVGLCVSMI